MKRLPRLFLDDIHSMSPKQHLYFWILPVSILLLLLVFYFSGIDPLVQFVAPWANREWGALENLQLLCLLGVSGLSFYAAFKKPVLILKVGFVLLGCAAFFVFLEEMDYGRHFIELFDKDRKTLFQETFQTQNFHNYGNNNTYFRRTSYLVILLLFGIAPFLGQKYLPPVIRYLIPPPRMLILVLLFVFSYWLPRFLVREGIFDAGPLNPNNPGEFTELTVYLIFLVYTIHLVFEKEWPGRESPPQSPAASRPEKRKGLVKQN